MKGRRKVFCMLSLLVAVCFFARGAALYDEDEAANPSPQFFLLQAIWANDADAVRDALKIGAEVQRPDTLGCVPFLDACRQETISMDVIFALLEANADVHATDRHGKTALYFACNNVRADLVSFLLNRGVFVDAATLVCAANNEVISAILKESVDRLVVAAHGGDDEALRRCMVLHDDCLKVVADLQRVIEQRKVAIAEEKRRYKVPVQRVDSEQMRVLARNHRGLVYSCEFDIVACERKIGLLLSYKEAYAKYTDA